MSLSLAEMYLLRENAFARRDRADAAIKKYDRMIKEEVLRREKTGWQVDSGDWTSNYRGQTGRILAAIWRSPKKKITFARLCKMEWSDSMKPKPIVTTTIWRINKRLEKTGCPYRVRSVVHPITREVQGYKLQKAPNKK